MEQSPAPQPACRSVFQNGAQATTSEAYTRLWIKLINQIERGKESLSSTHGSAGPL